MAQTRQEISLSEFENACKKFDSKGTGYILTQQIDELTELLLNEKFRDEKNLEMKNQFKEKISKLVNCEEEKIPVEALKQVFVPRENILMQISLESKLTSIDFMRIWNHYDTDKDGYLNFQQLHGFIHDLMATKNLDVSENQVKKATQSFIDVFDRNQDSQIELSELAKILPVEENFLECFRPRQSISKESFDEIWKHYDQDNSGTISGDELDAFIRDYYSKADKPCPDLPTIKRQKEMLLMLVDQNADNQLAKDELQLFLSVKAD